ncbi:Octamer-binding transcription factor [Trema orientale]|uniref:Homeobox-leucine zipper protein n=1 Tax=Trema orientale TaxID=63057 RepID=A0A2P5F4S9_TREOI|nr:Octamer-binding transcription factor [Trema orientale]
MNTLTCGGKNKKRFSDEQIKSLEVMFRSDSRPESRTKQQLAGELGLQPRQVAIWFQNRRARSRTKQIEREYSKLKASYNTLVSSVESLKRENQALNIQLQEAKTVLRKDQGSGSLESDETGNGRENPFESKDVRSQNLLQSCKREVEVHHENVGKEAEFLDLAPSADGSLTSSVDWRGFESGCYVDESSCSPWWEFWS